MRQSYCCTPVGEWVWAEEQNIVQPNINALPEDQKQTKIIRIPTTFGWFCGTVLRQTTGTHPLTSEEELTMTGKEDVLRNGLQYHGQTWQCITSLFQVLLFSIIYLGLITVFTCTWRCCYLNKPAQSNCPAEMLVAKNQVQKKFNNKRINCTRFSCECSWCFHLPADAEEGSKVVTISFWPCSFL